MDQTRRVDQRSDNRSVLDVWMDRRKEKRCQFEERERKRCRKCRNFGIIARKAGCSHFLMTIDCIERGRG